ncbi:hypothetical protein ACJ73_09055 [Blastomyces percursus]|uniref:Uncharacterized protein n=1 Tax=Blastomyces percursus TaxID=1658174 RepID=A0A1J9QFG7_9EURO|nr:hypothetical protein ACJ73_09055 [Blastomyces percursus]
MAVHDGPEAQLQVACPIDEWSAAFPSLNDYSRPEESGATTRSALFQDAPRPFPVKAQLASPESDVDDEYGSGASESNVPSPDPPAEVSSWAEDSGN